MLRGIAASPGVAIGKVFCLGREHFRIKKKFITKKEIPGELSRLEEIVAKTKGEILKTKREATQKISPKETRIFDAHLLILEDPYLRELVVNRVTKDRFNLEYALRQTGADVIDKFKSIGDEYLKSRVEDIQDVGTRLLRNLLGRERDALDRLEEEVIVIAHDLSPSDTVQMHKERVIGIATDIGGRTSHTAIMARSLEIPAVVGLKDITARVQDEDRIIIDGDRGVVWVNPGEATLRRYQIAQARRRAQAKELEGLRERAPKTLDGHRVRLTANIELPLEVSYVKEHGAIGIGLYRTEFLYLNRSTLPSEEEQYLAYQLVASQMVPNSVVIRTLDIGGDKFLSQLNLAPEMNPFLGLRAIRLCLHNVDLFKTQLGAILRASKQRNLKIMYPMISGIEELRAANQVLREVKSELKDKGVSFDEHIPVGAMIEIPSAALAADELAKEVDFFSIGTNDLIQYFVAVDRVNERVAYLYEPLNPTVLRLVKSIIDAGHRAGIWVSLCGEMASDPLAVLVLLGLGLDEFSIGAISIPQVKNTIRSVTFEAAKRLADGALSLSTAKEVERFIRRRVARILPSQRG